MYLHADTEYQPVPLVSRPPCSPLSTIEILDRPDASPDERHTVYVGNARRRLEW